MPTHSHKLSARPLLAALLAVTALGPISGTLAAQETASSTPIASSLTAHVVTAAQDGGELFQQAKRVNPGDVIEYRIVHRNRAAQPLEGFVVNGKIPNGTSYVARSAKSAQPDTLEVKIPGEPWQVLPAYKTVTDADGNEQRVAAKPADYIGLRWKLSKALPKDARSRNIYRVKVAQ